MIQKTTIRQWTVALVGGLSIAAASHGVWAGEMSGSSPDLGKTFMTLVGKDGSIKLPEGFRKNWSHLGSWIVSDAGAPGHGFHDVYTQPEAVQAFRETGKFPDGTVLVKEIRKIESGAQTTGMAQWAGDTNVWFVMVKDSRNRFANNVHWQKGWGWALFEAANPKQNVSKGFGETCMACHTPVAQTDWVFTNGYPTLKK